MYLIRTEADFDAAHFLKGYEGKCRNLHGHRWRVVAELGGERLCEGGQTDGMLWDFSECKHALRGLCEYFDHSLIYETGSLRQQTIDALKEEEFRLVEVAFRPTAENFAKYFFDRIKELGYAPRRVSVYETPTNCAVYEVSA